nr:hypothetical protein BgiMline_018715 [Biomphalaria glabrata]
MAAGKRRSLTVFLHTRLRPYGRSPPTQSSSGVRQSHEQPYIGVHCSHPLHESRARKGALKTAKLPYQSWQEPYTSD